jgi:hypothetical protein
MFSSDLDDSVTFSPALFLAQIVLAPLGGLIVGLIGTIILEAVFKTRNSNVAAYISYSVAGLQLGRKMQQLFPRAVHSGGYWAWIAPAIVLILGIIVEAKRGAEAQIHDIFAIPDRPGADGIGLLLITLPVVASCFYSVGVISATPRGTKIWQRCQLVIFDRTAKSNIAQ